MIRCSHCYTEKHEEEILALPECCEQPVCVDCIVWHAEQVAEQALENSEVSQ